MCHHCTDFLWENRAYAYMLLEMLLKYPIWNTLKSFEIATSFDLFLGRGNASIETLNYMRAYCYLNIVNSLFRGHELTLEDQMLVTEADEIMSRVGDPQGIAYYKPMYSGPILMNT